MIGREIAVDDQKSQRVETILPSKGMPRMIERTTLDNEGRIWIVTSGFPNVETREFETIMITHRDEETGGGIVMSIRPDAERMI